MTPYVTDRGKLAFSLRATGIKAAACPGRVQGRGLMPAKRVTALTLPVDVLARPARSRIPHPPPGVRTMARPVMTAPAGASNLSVPERQLRKEPSS